MLLLFIDIKNTELLKLYLLKRNLNNLKKIKSLPSYNCTEIDDPFIAPEIILTLSEIYYRNNNYTDSENIMYDFWSNCSIELDPRVDWMYNNYPNTLLNSFRMSMWHGSLIPQFNKFFREQYVDDIYSDKRFESINMAIKLWINATISFGLDESLGKN